MKARERTPQSVVPVNTEDATEKSTDEATEKSTEVENAHLIRVDYNARLVVVPR